MKVQGTILNPGEAAGPTLVLTEPVSFWGAFDPRTGKIVDTHHAQCGVALGGHILLLPETRGSGGTPGGIAEAVRRGTGPTGIILITPDINLAVGAQVAAALYDRQCPVIAVSAEDYALLVQQPHLSIARDGSITV
ncbi:aconitase X swivel domain-containing protein [Aestuariivirga sp.]|uniref:aconitase X swivel domain-containing protein n=1 Tax=Aestuariivirga sp. TaxID=2650926 RepID=UPI0039E6D1E7